MKLCCFYFTCIVHLFHDRKMLKSKPRKEIMSAREPIYDDLDAYYDRQEYLNYLQDQELEENIINSPKEAVKVLLDQLINGKDQSYDFLIRAMQVLAKEHDLMDYAEIDESEIKVTFDREVDAKIKKIQDDQKDKDTRMAKYIKNIEDEAYGVDDSVDSFLVDSAISNLFWNLGIYRTSNRNLTIKRK